MSLFNYLNILIDGIQGDNKLVPPFDLEIDFSSRGQWLVLSFSFFHNLSPNLHVGLLHLISKSESKRRNSLESKWVLSPLFNSELVNTSLCIESYLDLTFYHLCILTITDKCMLFKYLLVSPFCEQKTLNILVHIALEFLH